MLHTCWSWSSWAQAPRLGMPLQCPQRMGPPQGTPEKQCPGWDGPVTLNSRAKGVGEGQQPTDKRAPCPLSLMTTPFISPALQRSKHGRRWGSWRAQGKARITLCLGLAGAGVQAESGAMEPHQQSPGDRRWSRVRLGCQLWPPRPPPQARSLLPILIFMQPL